MLNCAQTQLMLTLADEHASALRTSLHLLTATFSSQHPSAKILRLRLERIEGARAALLKSQQALTA
jgi:hypothetical protein